jgi:hypothetical protein
MINDYFKHVGFILKFHIYSPKITKKLLTNNVQ